jgi:hypothetical protein
MAFRISSVESIVERFILTFQRFPLSILVAVFGTVLAIISVDISDGDVQQNLIRGVFSCVIALSAFMAVRTFGEAKNLSIAATWGLKAIVLVLVFTFYLFVDELDSYRFPVFFILLSLASHLLVAFAPWIGGQRDGFWQYNKQLFLQILTAFIYSGVLFAGLSIAILAVDQLFKAGIEVETYLRLFFLIGGIFNTIFFLSGVPKDYEALGQDESYPKGLKIFTQYILLPLVFIYLVILYTYMAKIIINAEWPVGWVAILVLCFSIAGIFSFLLIYPLRNLQDHKWIMVFNRWFYIALIPLTLMLFVAIFKRLQQYGFTEERYFVLLLALWLTGIIGYFLIGKKGDIRVIPGSLFLLTILAVFTAFPVARVSQLNRLEKVLVENELLTDGKIAVGDMAPSFEVEKNLSSILDFLDERGKMQAFQPFVNFDLKELKKDLNKNKQTQVNLAPTVMKKLDMTYRSHWEVENDRELNQQRQHFNYYADVTQVLDVSGYAVMVNQNISFSNNALNQVLYLKHTIQDGFTLIYNDKTLKVDLEKFAGELADKYPFTSTERPEEIQYNEENEVLKARFYFEDIRFAIKPDGEMTQFSGRVWILAKEK